MHPDHREIQINTSFLKSPLLLFDTVTSTNTMIQRQLQTQTGCRVIAALEQRTGEGRMERTWESPPSKGLWFSFNINKQIHARKLILLNFAIALGIRKAILGIMVKDMDVKLKWPNDIVINSRKAGGIILKSKFRNGIHRDVICGVGINLNQNRSDFPIDLRDRAISLKIVDGLKRPIESTLIKVIEELDKYLLFSFDNGFATTLDDWQVASTPLGTEILVSVSNSQKQSGIYRGIDTEGRLLLEIDGKTIVLTSGDVEV